ncbi:MAG: NADH-quinone oxidoreductase subunit NuoE [Gammaproteobacteria bacterium]|nr:NADH-quinone oxidoreductase subunit NuoE [Gammaproteobacteria bacterium]
MKANTLNLITPEARAEIDSWIARYPAEQRQSATMPALRIVQDMNGGYLTQELMDAVAEYLHIPAIAAYEVATFYSMYEHNPVGRHKISVCTNVSCMLCGSEDIVEFLEKRLGVSLGETTADGRFTLKSVECLGACGGAPMFQIGRQYFENLTPEKVETILAEFR